MTTPVQLPLGSRIAASLDPAHLESTAVLAGHFAIFTAGARAHDLLDEPRSLSAHTDMIDMARGSWIAAADLLARVDGPRLLVLMDDIQFVQPALPDRAARERLAAALAGDYLRRTRTLPPFHRRELDAREIDTARVVQQRGDSWIFSERALRAAAVTRIRAAAAAGTPGAALQASADGSRITVRDAELGEHTLVHSGNTSCAGGYLELVLQLHERGFRRLVAVVPRRCLGPVAVGTHLARALFGATALEVTNLPADGQGDGAAGTTRRTA